MIDQFRRWRSPKIPLGTHGPWLFPRTLRLPLVDLASHMHIIGKTGSGKSRFLANLILNLVEHGQPLTLIDPRGDLARLVLAQLVARGFFREDAAYERLLYLDLPAAARQERYLPFNVLRQPLPPHSLAVNIKEAFHRAWPRLGDGAAPMFDTLLQTGIKVLLSNDEPVTRLHRLLSDRDYRHHLLRQERDPDVAGFFTHHFERLAPRDQIAQAGSALRRAHLLTFSPVLRHSLEQHENLLDFRRLIDEGRSLIINLALPESDALRLLGCLMTVSAEQAALTRSELSADERGPNHVLVIDEWSEFAAQSSEALSRMLDLTRKVGLFAVLAHQTWSQAGSRIRGALQNVGLEVAFRLGREDAEDTARRFGQVDSGAIKHEIADPGAADRGHPLYAPLIEQWEHQIQLLQRLPNRHLLLRGQDGRIRRLRALAIPDPPGIAAQLAAVEETYLRRYFRPLDRTSSGLNGGRVVSREMRLSRRLQLKQRDLPPIEGP